MANFRLIFEWVFKRQRPPELSPVKYEIAVNVYMVPPLTTATNTVPPMTISASMNPPLTTATNTIPPLTTKTSMNPPLSTRLYDGNL